MKSTRFVQFLCPSSGLLMMYRGNGRNMQFHPKNKFEKIVQLIGFIIRNLTRCTVTWTSNLLIFYTPHSDTLYVCEQELGDPWLFFETKIDPSAKKMTGKQCITVSTAQLHTPPQCTTVSILRHSDWYSRFASPESLTLQKTSILNPIKFLECAQPRLYVHSFVVSTSFSKVFH
jgi:predicted RNA-binding Zn-ribbon protein involved in translation (DUF1610 family)